MRHFDALLQSVLSIASIALFVIFALSAPVANAQIPGRIDLPLSVFLDCRADCDSDLIRTEIDWVNWVRDRTAADVHVLVTQQSAGTGGQRFSIALLGERTFAGRGDTLFYISNAITTSDERRRGVMQMLALGLVPFAVRTPSGSSLLVSTMKGSGSTPVQQGAVADPWKAWVLEVELSGSTDGEENYTSRYLSSQFSANRVTEGWKTGFSYEYSYRSNTATVQDVDSLGVLLEAETFKNVRRDWDSQFDQIKSVTDHGGLGLDVELASQKFRNQKLRYSTGVAFEYSVFPYVEATRRSLTIRYGVGVTGYQYADTTIFDRISETVPVHSLEARFRTRQPWGDMYLSAQHENFLSDASKRSTELQGSFNVRVFRGFSVRMGAGYSWIRDQIYLPKGTQNTVDVLLRRRALSTGFEYNANVGVSYTFGSIFNNVVNPRF